ncbi:hypothetical protein GCM10017771_87800 [Streptomyces capitiformicae]|uniref:Uncharacterized protein n=1 Tax=Streptomyces capitiformicae TaxID=2014920 RepID=A0A918ZR93_9ACTN|nr:hypothetical protein GCM10017771_87800 [Streptomyces capitiformicae]
MDDDFVLETLVHQGFLKTVAAPLGRLVEEGGAGGVVVGGGGQDNDADDQSQHIDGQPALAPGLAFGPCPESRHAHDERSPERGSIP